MLDSLTFAFILLSFPLLQILLFAVDMVDRDSQTLYFVSYLMKLVCFLTVACPLQSHPALQTVTIY